MGGWDTSLENLRREYQLDQKPYEGAVPTPGLSLRRVRFLPGGPSPDAVERATQATLKPVLSFYHRRAGASGGQDVRDRWVRRIQEQLDHAGLSQYVARPGGKTSIDVTLEKIDKAYALEWLIDRLNVRGRERMGEAFASRVVYFGDEVIVGGGNDYPVTRIPGLLVFAVAPDSHRVPFLSGVLVPVSRGLDGTRAMLREFNDVADEGGSPCAAMDGFKRRVLLKRIRSKLDDAVGFGPIPVADLQALHSFVTLFSRQDPVARGWLMILREQLDRTMEHLARNPEAVPPAAGTGSHSRPRQPTQ